MSTVDDGRNGGNVELTGSTVVVTGANSGIGLETARELARLGAHVVLACRDPERGRDAVRRLEDALAEPSVELVQLDLSSQRSVADAARAITSTHDRLDVLVNNAGVMASPAKLTEDGFELQMATNHLGHFSLTAALLDLLLTTAGSRVVTVTSMMHRMGRIDPDHLGIAGYGRWRAYARSKLANLLFAYELHRRLEACGTSTISVAVHPGWTRSNLVATGPAAGGSALRARMMRTAAARFGQPTRSGALPLILAATAPDLSGGVCIGPTGPLQLAGAPGTVPTSRRSRDAGLARALWRASEAATGAVFPFEVLPAP